MIELVDNLSALRTEGVPAGRAVVIRAFGSSPRPEGAAMIATADGRISGSVSGGCVEGATAEEIVRAIAAGRSRVVRYGISDEQARGIGLSCGGTIDVLIQPCVSDAIEAAARRSAGGDAAATGTSALAEEAVAPVQSCAVVTPLPDDSPGPEPGPYPGGQGEIPAAEIVAWQGGRLDGSLGSPALDAELAALARESLERGVSRTVSIGGRQLFIEVFATRPRLVIVGAGQIAVALVALAQVLGYEAVVVDARQAFATRERFPTADRIVVGWPDQAAEAIGLGPADSVAVLSHDAKFDEPAVSISLARGCRYVGAIGSRKTQAARRERLLAEGMLPENVDRLRGPIGLDLGGRTPAETALAIMAEVVATRRGGTGLPLRDKAREQARSASEGAPGPTLEAATEAAPVAAVDQSR